MAPVPEPCSSHEQEALLALLLRRPAVARAVGLAMDGRQEQGRGVLVADLREVLGDGASPPDEGALAAAAAVSSPEGEEGGDAAAAGSAAASSSSGKRAASGEPSGSSPAKLRKLTLSALQRLPATCICIIASGLHGCGKSTLCNVLQEVMGGVWLNHDEMEARRREAGSGGGSSQMRKSFNVEFRALLTKTLAKANKAVRDKEAYLIFVDRCNTTKSMRGDLLNELKNRQWRKRGGKALLVDFTHASDTFGYGADGQLSKRLSEQHVALCAGRVEERGRAHQTLQPTPKLRGNLQSLAKAADAPSPEEGAQFDSRVSVDVSLPPPELAAQVLEHLRGAGWLPNLKGVEEMRPKLEVAWQAYQRAEAKWREGAALDDGPAPHVEFLAQCREAHDREQAQERAELASARIRARELEKTAAASAAAARAAVAASAGAAAGNGAAAGAGGGSPAATAISVWKIDLPEVAGVVTQRGILPTTFVPMEHTHCVLLRVNADGTAIPDEAGDSGAPLLSAERVAAMRDALEALEGEEIEVRMTEIVIEESVACAIVELPPIVPCAFKVPHVTLGTKMGVSPGVAARLLEEVRGGRTGGVTCIKLPKPRPLSGRLVFESPGRPPRNEGTGSVA